MMTEPFEFARIVLAFRFEVLRLGNDPFAKFETVALTQVEVFLDAHLSAIPVSNTLT